MPGKAGRSGRPKNVEQKGVSAKPEPPYELSQTANKHFNWLVNNLYANDSRSVWSTVDGVTLVKLAELIEDCERMAAALASDPTNDKLIKTRIQLADRVYKFSAIVGLTPKDRQRLPQPETEKEDEVTAWENS